MVGLEQVLSPDELTAIRAKLPSLAFTDGRGTAGWHARQVKQNAQGLPSDPAIQPILADIEAALRRHAIFSPAILPKTIRLMLNRYETGDAYGRHVDDAFMNGVRTDVSLTLFLSDPADYDGGELIIETPAGEQAVKLPAGAAILYPATTLHRVEPVTRGVRLACVGWVESRVRDAGAREILFDLERARRGIFAASGKTPEFDLVSKASANLMRRWGE